jgi:hypothetical protein
MGSGRGCAAAAVSGLALLLSCPRAHAQRDATPAAHPGPDARRDAARKFGEGTRAFDAGDFSRAAQAFDTAYALAPHEDALWNAARAWHRAGELARAANEYAQYLREAPPNASGRGVAQAALAQLAQKLGRVEIHVASGVEDVRLDDSPVDAPVVYVLPGAHAVRGKTAQGIVEERHTLKEGGALSVLLAPLATTSETPATAPRAPATMEPAPPSDTASRSSGWPPGVVVVEGGLTLVVVGLAVASGLDTLSTLRDFDAAPTQDRLDSGRSKQLRTNILIGASIGLGALTAVTAIWLVDWRSGARSTRVGVGLGSASLEGCF